jgi:lipoate---protein ligase
LIKHFENTLTNQTYILTDDEIDKVKEMAKKYESKDWIFKKQPPHTKTLKKRITGGLIEVMIDMHKGLIKNFKILGDFFDTKPLKQFEELFIGKEFTKKIIDNILKSDDIKDYILDVNSEEFKNLLYEGIIVDE